MHIDRWSCTAAGYEVVARKAVLVCVAAALSLLAGCAGPASPLYPPATTQSPAAGITLQKITITPSNSIILLAESRQLFATGVYSDGSSLDITSQVTWSASSTPSTTNFVTVNTNGMATASSVGATVVSASVGTVTGLLQLVVGTNGFTSTTMAILPVPFKNSQIDVGYIPLQSTIQGNYAVQEVNLDADQLSSVLPVPLALMASIPMPAGFVPNATAANQNTSNVAVISYTSPNVQIIDASNNPVDVNSNALIATYAAPVKQTVTINGITCMICGAVVNPLNGQLILSTAEGFLSMDMSSGAFTTMPFSPAPSPTANFSINPVAASPYILTTNPSQGTLQVLDLKSNAVTTYNSVSPDPTSAAIDLVTNFVAIGDGSTNDQPLADFTNPESPQFIPDNGIGICSGIPNVLNMVAFGTSANAVIKNASHTLLTSQTNGSCVGIEVWPQVGFTVSLPNIFYGYGPMPATPDNNTFVTGSDPNSIATFTSVLDKKNYGLLIDENQQWIAKISFANAIAQTFIGGNGPGSPALPLGALNTPPLAAGIAGDGVIFLPTPITDLTVSQPSIDFGSVAAGTSSPQILITVANIGASNLSPQITLTGSNAGDFSYISNCSTTLAMQTNCPVYVTFSPTTKGATSSATLTVTSTGVNPQKVALTGSGT